MLFGGLGVLEVSISEFCTLNKTRSISYTLNIPKILIEINVLVFAWKVLGDSLLYLE